MMLLQGLITLSDYNADGFLGFQVDLPGEKLASCPSAEPWSPYGFFSRPRDPELDVDDEPDAARACGALYFWHGSQLHVLPVGDPRTNPKLAPLSKGSSMQYSATGAFFLLDGVDGDGSTTLYVPYAFSGDTPAKAFLLQFDVPNNQAVLRHGDGPGAVLSAASASIHNAAGDAYVEAHASGITLNGNTVVNGGMTIGSPVGATPLAMGIPTQAWMVGIEAALQVMAAAIDAKMTASPGVTVGAVNSALGGIAAAKASVSATKAFGI